MRTHLHHLANAGYLLTLGLGAPLAMAETITIRADSWCPFNCVPQSAKPGYMIEIASAALGKAGHKVDYQNLNWSRALAAARDGSFTAVVGASDEEVRENKLIVGAAPLGRSINCFVTHKDGSWQYKGVASLAGRTIGAIQDYAYGDTLDAYFKANPKVIQAVTGDDALLRNLEKLRNKRLDAVVEDQAVLAYTINEKNWQGHYKDAGCERSVTPSGLHIAFSPKHPKAREYARLLQDEVTAMRADGRLKTLLAKYGVPDWQ
ncbi:transporter substrate-binding domain-containing protein [Chitinimonas viridis]|uniref:Transporter substrate-binding domain-containing protein n=1 Tax=Chitinimonas viridis TaxID=664880 RepID=A0ABT8BCA0_9NEIS|nr:transporter substrate-binding domain-containing protein [Chitinimonas viridis]MDN3579191.1 transporter substrate-binding domain-containing protein [Chitinimonas viridis]